MERTVLLLLIFLGEDKTEGNSSSTTDKEDSELFMKESIDLGALH